MFNADVPYQMCHHPQGPHAPPRNPHTSHPPHHLHHWHMGSSIPQSPINPFSNPHASFALSTHTFPTAIPPPSLNTYPLMNLSMFFRPVKLSSPIASPTPGFPPTHHSSTELLSEDTACITPASLYLYFDDEGYTHWQGEMSGLSLLDLLVEHLLPSPLQPWTSQSDLQVHANPNDGNSMRMQWFELFGHLCTLLSAHRPTIYTLQSVLLMGVYAIGLRELSQAFVLLVEAVTLSLDMGLHQSVDNCDVFNTIKDEVCKCTFWCVYLWDKQACSHFGQ
ncbi:hypothetical protein AcV5_003056 [Taiwanofungus camphoratus]|nr:hypothetical protein AcV5_003056 [Antrodia cinnamomea]